MKRMSKTVCGRILYAIIKLNETMILPGIRMQNDSCIPGIGYFTAAFPVAANERCRVLYGRGGE